MFYKLAVEGIGSSFLGAGSYTLWQLIDELKESDSQGMKVGSTMSWYVTFYLAIFSSWRGEMLYLPFPLVL